jgi:hypothetical protein
MIIGSRALTPPKTNRHLAGRRRDHLSAGVGVARLVDLTAAMDSPFEDRPGLVRAVSSRGVTPPQDAAFGTPPLQGLVEQRHEWLDVASDRSGVAVTHKLHVRCRHVHLRCRRPTVLARKRADSHRGSSAMPAVEPKTGRPLLRLVGSASITVSFLATSSAPTPLYGTYQAAWGFSPLTTTVVFGVYAVALFAALLTAGRRSDHIGWRPVLLAGIAGQVAAMVFAHAHSVAALLAARTVQDLATGLAIGAVGAACDTVQ